MPGALPAPKPSSVWATARLASGAKYEHLGASARIAIRADFVVDISADRTACPSRPCRAGARCPEGGRIIIVVKRSPCRRQSPSPARCLAEAELFADFKRLTPFRYRPFTRSFDTYADYERWKRGQKNPWYR